MSPPSPPGAEAGEIDGKHVYGLVHVAFWRSIPEGEIDHEHV